MGDRKLLAVGSQCKALGGSPLTFLPQLLEEAYEVMVSPEMGNCKPVFGDREPSLISDPTVQDLKSALRRALTAAAQDESTLFLLYLGHGTFVGDDFYLLPLDADEVPDSDSGVHLVNLITEFYRKNSGIDGLVVLLDTCFGGVAGTAAAQRWIKDLEGQLRFEVLSASGAHPAYDGCLTRSIIQSLKNGIPSVPSPFLSCQNLHGIAQKACPRQKPQHPTYNADEGLYIGRNRPTRVRNVPWIDPETSSQVAKLTASFEPTPQLETIVAASISHNLIVVESGPGEGKSAISAAMAYPDVTGGVVPPMFLQAVVFIDELTTPEILARRLAMQLSISVPNFEAAQRVTRQAADPDTFSRLDALRRLVFKPLANIKSLRLIRIVFDGLDCMEPASRQLTWSLIDEVSTSDETSHVHLIVSCRSDTIPSFAREKRHLLGKAAETDVASYLQRKGLDSTKTSVVLNKAEGNWLMARLLSDLMLRNPNVQLESLAGGMEILYDSLLESLNIVPDVDDWFETKPILEILTVASVGPNIPMELLCKASSELKGPARPFAVRNLLAKLRPILIRSAPGTDEERCGLFHQTLSDYLRQSATRLNLDLKRANRVIADAIELLAPASRQNRRARGPVYRYAFTALQEHLWAADQFDRIFTSLKNREPQSLPEALELWKRWHARMQEKLGKENPDVLAARTRIAELIGQLGNAQKALEELNELYVQSRDTLGIEDALSLKIRANVAYFEAEKGSYETALEIISEVAADDHRVLGPLHWQTLEARNDLAFWTAECGDIRAAIHLFESLLADQIACSPRDDEAILVTRNNLAHWTGESGNVKRCLELYEELLKDQKATLGDDHEDVLLTRQNIASWKEENGFVAEALHLSEALLPDRIRILGFNHPQTLTTRWMIAAMISELGEHERSLGLLYGLLRDIQSVCGIEHPDALRVRAAIAKVTGRAGGVTKALQLFDEVLSDEHRILGPEHKLSLITAQRRAFLIGQRINAEEAIEIFNSLLMIYSRKGGERAPDTLKCRKFLARVTSCSGRNATALEQFRDLLSDDEKVLSENHPEILECRLRIAALECQLNPSESGLQLLKETVEADKRILGDDHNLIKEGYSLLRSCIR